MTPNKPEPKNIPVVVTTFKGDDEIMSRKINASNNTDVSWMLRTIKWAAHTGHVIEIASPETLEAEE